MCARARKREEGERERRDIRSCMREGERESVCVQKRGVEEGERERECVCVCERERMERERERAKESETAMYTDTAGMDAPTPRRCPVDIRSCMRERERERERVSERE